MERKYTITDVRVDPVTGLQCRSDGAVFLPGSSRHPAKWTFGHLCPNGYLMVGFRRRTYLVHRLICRSFHGEPPKGRPQVDHINRNRTCNDFRNLRWVSPKENSDNQEKVDFFRISGRTRACDDIVQYNKERRMHVPEAAQAARDGARQYYARKKAAGYSFIKEPNGKQHWIPNTLIKSGDQ